MTILEYVISAPSAEDDLLDKKPDAQTADYGRYLEMLAFVGMTAIGDSQVSVHIGSKKVAIKRNSATNASPNADDYIPVNNRGGEPVPKGSTVSAILDVDGGGNAGIGLIFA